MMRALVAVAVVCLPCSLEAAVVKTSTFGCRTESDAVKAATLQAKNDAAALATFTKPKIVAGDCVALGRGVTIDPETRRSPLACVRLAGGLECYWIADSLIELHPADPVTPFAGRGGNRRR